MFVLMYCAVMFMLLHFCSCVYVVVYDAMSATMFMLLSVFVVLMLLCLSYYVYVVMLLYLYYIVVFMLFYL